MDVELLRKGFRVMTTLIDKGRKIRFVDIHFFNIKDWYNSITDWEGVS